MKVVVREAQRWPWGYVAVRFNKAGIAAWTLHGSHLEDVRREAQRIAAIYEAPLEDQTQDARAS
jgi:hypothetical protein